MGKSLEKVPNEVRERAKQIRESLKHCPPISELVSPEDLADGAPFYFVLRSYVAELRSIRQELGLTLADIAAKTGLALETLSRLETGNIVNPTWQTLGKYALAVGCRPKLEVERDEAE